MGVGDEEGLLSSRRCRNGGDVLFLSVGVCELCGEAKSGRPIPRAQQTSQTGSKYKQSGYLNSKS